jgi:CRISPR/Cas system-associated exonuclease Cas4 (RecB family)
VPHAPAASPSSDALFPASTDEVFGALADRQGHEPEAAASPEERLRPEPGAGGPRGNGAPPTGRGWDTASSGEEARLLRSPWKWERLLAESRVVASEERWKRRLEGLAAECKLQRQELERTEPDAARIAQLGRKIADLNALSAFALPIIGTLAAWPARAHWGEWLERFEALAPRVLKKPDHVLRVLADLRPMAAIGPIDLDEATRVLADRLGTIEAEAPDRRYGRVFVATPEQLRGRSFDVVFVPALAERMFPQKSREDPLLLDQARRALGLCLPGAHDRAELEKLQLRLAVGAAAERLYVSFPTVEIGEGRPRVPSLYALEVWRAMTGRVPSADELQHAAARASQATLAWPAPSQPDDAIDALEHDLSTLRRLVDEPDERARGRAQYILQLNDCLQRSVRERYMRGKRSWSHWDGLTRVTERTAAVIAAHRLGARAYSLSALQKYATCPYQFLLSAIFRLRPAEDLQPFQRLDPLTRGSLFHAVQASFYRRLKDGGALPVVPASRDRALKTLDASMRDVAAEYRELLAPAVERVWNDEIAAIRRDLRLWVDDIVRAGGEWVPLWFEWSFGLKNRSGHAERDPDSHPDPVAIDGRFLLHGSIDLVEQHAASGQLRVTDHKTGRYRGRDQMIVGGGTALQPVLYGVALESALGRPVSEGRLYYATTDGGYRDVRIPLTPDARRLGIEVLEIIDRAVQAGFLPAAPDERACTWCDFRAVCGPAAPSRANRKAPTPLADLFELRKKR